nr:MAG TPA: hypothetical protein [Caudoviricetes sp.]
MRKEYLINELAAILGCSRTAIAKKIVENKETGKKRYKNRYDVVMYKGQLAILLDDEDLESEKSMSRGFKNVIRNGANTAMSEDVIDVEPIKEETHAETVLNFTERYIKELKTFQETTYNELKNLSETKNNLEKQVLLLEDSQKKGNEEYQKTRAENVTLKLRNTVLTVALGVAIMLLMCFVTFYITYTTAHNTAGNVVETVQKNTPQNPNKN